MTLPNFLIIGAGKSGTTSLYYYLNQHPDIFMSPNKEPRFFVLEGEEKTKYEGPGVRRWLAGAVFDYGKYCSLFDNAKGERVIGEASNRYLWDPRAAPNIKKYLPNGKMIAILRNPIDKAFSQYSSLIRLGIEPYLCFRKAINHEMTGARKKWVWAPYIEHGFYHKHLLNYFKYFKMEQIRIYIYDDFLQDNLNIVRDIFNFLDVDSNYIPDFSKKHNKAPNLIPKNQFFYTFIGKTRVFRYLRRNCSKIKLITPPTTWLDKQFYKQPQMSESLRKELQEIFMPDIKNLQDLINRDLSLWLD